MPNSVSIKQARKLLGSASKALSDDQIEELVLVLELLANDQLAEDGSKNGNAR